MKHVYSKIASALLLLLATPSLFAADVAKTAKPNVVLIFIDDLGYGDIGPFGSTKNRTANLDRMAKEGMKLTSFYAAPVCSVSRAQVVTGCYGQRVSIPGVFFPGGHNGISKSEHTVAELMKAQDYATMIIGKWHLGDQPEFLPTKHGFDHYFGLPYSNDMIKKAKVNSQPVVPLMRDDKVAELLTGDGQDKLTQRYTEEAVKFITQNKDHPFFLYMPHTAVHTPIHPGEAFRDKSKNGRFGDWVEEVDWSVGQVLDTLRSLKLAENTLVVFTSDNGPWLIRGKDGGEAGPLRGGKGTTWEGGVREPTIAWWPGKIAAGSTCDAMACNMDFLPTFVKLAGGIVPADRKIDGKDILPLLLGQTKESPHEDHYYYSGLKLQAVRSGPWKLAIAPQGEGSAKASPTVAASLEKPRLYNLEKDIGERTDVALDHPEVVVRLKAIAAKAAAELGDGKPGTEVRPAGYVENAVTLYPLDDSEKPAPANRGKPGEPAKPADLSSAKVGDTLAGDQAPQIAGLSWTISCEITTQAKDGVIVAQGGVGVGYSLYLKGGHAVFAVRQPSQAVTRITSSDPVAGTAKIEIQLAADGAMTLTIDGKSAATGKTTGVLSRQPQEPFCIGHDDGKTVDEYDGKSKFKGQIQNLKFSIAPAKTSPANGVNP